MFRIPPARGQVIGFLALLGGFLSIMTAAEPGQEGFTALWWKDGPPHYHTMQEPVPPPILCLAGTEVGLTINTRTLEIPHAGRFRSPRTATSILREETRGLEALPSMALQLQVRQGNRLLTCTGRGAEPKDEFLQPVRFIESGRFFQRVSIEGLEFADAQGTRLACTGRLEVALWPDGLSFMFELPRCSDNAGGELVLTAGDRTVTSPLSRSTRVSLDPLPRGPDPEGATLRVDSALGLRYDSELGCHVIGLPEEPWSNVKGTYYPEEHLDRLDRWRFQVTNPTGRAVTARLMFVQRHHLPITGFTPMLCDPDGTPSGIPVQISKNWHQRPDKGTLPHEGPWFHGCTVIRVPARSRREFLFQMAYARYGGVPAASHAQLSLIGWGHNQFWDQAALGSFGESICYEPGRVQRRCMIDDIRPLMTLPVAGGGPWSWAENCGGGDFLAWIDSEGRHRGSKATRADYRAYGPCLTDVNYLEASRDGSIQARMEVSLARSDDYLRAFHRFRYDIKAPVTWQRMAFYQLGADYYNETPTRTIAIGDRGGVTSEWAPPAAKDVFDRQALAMTGDQPWISIHGVDRSRLPKGTAAASRGLIVRSWKAVLDGQPSSTPHVSTYCTEWGKGNFKTAIELVPPPEVRALRVGDFVEAEVELVVFPSDPAAYYGPNQGFRAALNASADTWRLVQREASGNAIKATATRGAVARAYPLRLTADRVGRASVTIDGGVGWLPVTITNLRRHRGYELRVDGRLLDQSVRGRDFWQTDYDLATGRWNMTFNLPCNPSSPTRLDFGPTATP